MDQMIKETAIETAEATGMAVRERHNLVNNARSMHTVSRSSGPALRHPMFDWKASDKYQVMHNFEIEEKNIAITYNYKTQECNIQIVLNWQGQELRFIQTLMMRSRKMQNKLSAVESIKWQVQTTA